MLFFIVLILISFNYLLPANTITVIGIGRLGLCAALCFERAGYKVIGVDVNKTYVEALNNKSFSSPEPLVNKFLQESLNFKATCFLDEGLNFSDVYYIMVDTPSTTQKEAYDHSKLSSILHEINKRRVVGKHIVIGCTIFPGYIRNIGSYLIRDCTNCSLSYNPEFVAQGNIIAGLQNPDIVLIGEGSLEAGEIIETMYKRVCTNTPKICRMSTESAEITKIALNCYITTKIAYANMVGDIADKTPGADKYSILEAIGNDRRVGGLYFKPGYGFGGPCFPRDNRAFGSYAQQIGIEPLIPVATDEANKQHALNMVQQFLSENKEKYVFEHVTYKENCSVPIIEESQKLFVATQLANMGKKVVILDEHDVIAEVQKQFGSLFEYKVTNY